jgi:hypothetical protein
MANLLSISREFDASGREGIASPSRPRPMSGYGGLLCEVI